MKKTLPVRRKCEYLPERVNAASWMLLMVGCQCGKIVYGLAKWSMLYRTCYKGSDVGGRWGIYFDLKFIGSYFYHFCVIQNKRSDYSKRIDRDRLIAADFILSCLYSFRMFFSEVENCKVQISRWLRDRYRGVESEMSVDSCEVVGGFSL